MKINNLIVSIDSNIRQAVKQMDNGGIGIVFIEDKNNKIVGVLTDGDFRRAVLKGISLNKKITEIYNSEFIKVNEKYSDKEVINLFLSNRIERIPVLKDGKLIDVLFRENYSLQWEKILPEKKDLDIPVVIMAGGKGTRLKPFTDVFPKPLIPIWGKTMIEVIMDEYNKFGFNEFIISINYKGKLIKSYFEDLKHSYSISFIEETEFLGTVGSLKLLKVHKNYPIFVSNCDILIKDDYLKILDFHKAGKYDITMVAALIHHQVPYGVCTIKNEGELDKLMEKPEYDYLVNSGMYIINPQILDLIPSNQFFHITHLIEKIKKNGGKIGVYPVSEKSWVDVGQWSNYEKTVKSRT